MSFARYRILSIWIGLLIAVLLCSGCVNVTATNPANGATGVARDVVIKVTFDADAQPTSVNRATFLVEDSLGNSVSGAVTYANKVATFTPADQLALMHGYTVTLTTGIKNSLGFPMNANYSFSFTTGDGVWGTVRLIESDNAGSAYYPQIAVDADGNAVAVWQQSDGTRLSIWSNRYTPGGGWGTAQAIDIDTAGSAYNPQIAVNADGNAVAVWTQQTNIWSNCYTPSSGWGTAQLIETYSGNAYNPQIAIGADGNAVAVWYQHDGTRYNIWSNHYTPSGGWDVANLIETDAGDAQWPQVAADSDGNAVAVWHQYDGTRNNIWANRYTPSGGWGTAQLIETDNAGYAAYPQIAVDADGNAVAIWQQSDGTRSNIWSNRYTPSSGWGTAQLIETNDAGEAIAPQIALDTNGDALAVWEQLDDTGYNYSIWSNRYTPSSGWGAAQLIETYSGTAEVPQIAVDADGNAVAVWEQYDGARYNIWSNRYTPSGGWGTAQLIETDNGSAWYPQIAIDAGGNGVAVWQQYDGTLYNIWSNRFE